MEALQFSMRDIYWDLVCKLSTFYKIILCITSTDAMIDAIEKEKVHLSPFNLEIHVIFDSMSNDRKENSIECLIWSVMQ